MFESRRGWVWSAIGIGAGAAWLGRIGAVGLVAAIPLALVGAVFLSAGVSWLLWPGDRRVNEIAALTGLAGAILALPYLFVLGSRGGHFSGGVGARGRLGRGPHGARARASLRRRALFRDRLSDWPRRSPSTT